MRFKIVKTSNSSLVNGFRPNFLGDKFEILETNSLFSKVYFVWKCLQDVHVSEKIGMRCLYGDNMCSDFDNLASTTTLIHRVLINSP